MREDLLGYLLNALDDQQRERVEEALRKDPELQRQLEALKDELDSIDSNIPEFEPPIDLADRTCDLIDESGPRCFESQPEPSSARRYWSTSDWRELAGSPRNWSLADAIVTAGILVAVSMLFFPAIANSRFQSQLAGCQHNLIQVGQALTDYSEKKGGYFPSIPHRGNRAVAGIYAPLLMEEGYVQDPSLFVCPSSRLALQRADWNVPTLAAVDAASGIELLRLQRAMGGSYGYSLGYVRDGSYGPLRNDGRSHFALMSDTPSLHLAGHQSSNHGGLGQNVLFEDSRIQFISTYLNDRYFDVIFLNEQGYAAPGIDRNDSVIGQSFTNPFHLWDAGFDEG
jgi:hypothetical protein